MIELTLTITPLPCARIVGSTKRDMRTGPQKFVSIAVRARSIEKSSTRARQADTGVVDQHIDAPVSRQHGGDSSARRGIVGDVEGDDLHLHICRLRCGLERRRLGRVAHRRHDGVTTLGERDGGVKPDSLRANR